MFKSFGNGRQWGMKTKTNEHSPTRTLQCLISNLITLDGSSERRQRTQITEKFSIYQFYKPSQKPPSPQIKLGYKSQNYLKALCSKSNKSVTSF